MTKVAWSRDGDQWVGKFGKREARITEWDGPLGPYFELVVDGKSRGGSGGGTKADALKRAKASAAEMLAVTPKPKTEPKPGPTKAELDAHFDYVCKLCGL